MADLDQIDAHVDAHVEESVALLERLVAHRTDSQTQGETNFPGEARRCQEDLAAEMKRIGLEVELLDVGDYPAAVGKLVGRGSGSSLALNGHFDVVPCGDPAKWRSDPWQLTRSGDELVGRGVVDMKAGIVAQLFAIRALVDCGVSLCGDLFTHYVSDEEIVGESTKHLIASMPRTDAVVDSEPTGLAVVPVEGGLIHLRIEVDGEESHAGNRFTMLYPGPTQRGVNALEKAVKIITALQSLERDWAKKPQHPLLPPGFNTIMPGLMFAGPGGGNNGKLNIVGNAGTVPNFASVEYNIWYLPSETFEDVQSEVESYLGHVCALDPWLRNHPPRFTWKLNGIFYPPCGTPADHPLVTELVRAVGSLGLPGEVKGFGAASELAWYVEAGIPGSLFGPGAVDQAHSPNELVRMSEITAATKALARTIAWFCNREAR